MKFKFYPKESRLYDFLKFPSLVFYKEYYNKSENDNDYNELEMNDYLDLIKKVEDKLKPYIKDIEVFYIKDFLSKYNFIDLISKANSIFKYKSEKEYLDMLLTLNEKEINKNIIYSVIMINEERHEYSNEIMKKAEQISMNKDEILSCIKGLSIEADVKWNLFLMIEEPIKYMRMYVDLMNNLLPIFKDVYEPYENEVNNYGQYLVNLLNTDGSNGLKEITNSILDLKVIDAKEIKILITVMLSYNIVIVGICKDKYIGWGLKVEEAFKKMKEINENKTNERVQIFKNLGDKTRYEVLKLIASGQTSTKKIANALGVSSATISYHINNFITSNVIKLDKSNRKYGYVVNYRLLNETIKYFKEDLMFPKEFR